MLSQNPLNFLQQDIQMIKKPSNKIRSKWNLRFKFQIQLACELITLVANKVQNRLKVICIHTKKKKQKWD